MLSISTRYGIYLLVCRYDRTHARHRTHETAIIAIIATQETGAACYAMPVLLEFTQFQQAHNPKRPDDGREDR